MVFFLQFAALIAQPTIIQGTVTDAVTREPLPFVQVGFIGTTSGTTTDLNGHFQLSNKQDKDSVRFQMMGYAPVIKVVPKGKTTKRMKIAMMPKTNMMHKVVVTASKGGGRYKRRGNPAVELIKKTIEHKELNRTQSISRFSRDVYEKTTLALNDFHPDFENKRLWRKLNFLEKYIDLTPFDYVPILTISMREVMMKESFCRHPNQSRTLVTARRIEGLDDFLGPDGIDESLSALFVPIDIYDNDIEMMLNHFTSPLNSTIATTFYRYYITDTVTIGDVKCVEVAFAPANERNYGFTGQMYIALDSSYAVMKYSMTVSQNVNLNFVHGLTIVQTFNENRLPDRCDTYGRMYAGKHTQQLYAHQTRVYYNYDISDSAALLPDSLFAPFTNTAALPNIKMRRKVWNELRPIELTPKETVIDSLRYELARLPEMRALKKTAEITITGYAATHSKRDSSYFDIGPIYNFLSYNHEEGWRVRFGGMTTARLNPHNFLEGYVAYGFKDKRPKFNTYYIHTFDEKKHQSHERPLSLWSIGAAYDLEVPGQSLETLDRDNISSSNEIPHKVQYVAQGIIRLRKEWPNHINIDTWLAARRYEPAGILQYMQYQDDGSLAEVHRFGEAEWTAKVSLCPIRPDDSGRPASASLLNMKKDYLTVHLTHRIAIMSLGFMYQRSDMSAEKRFWLGAFGYLDTKFRAGIIWNQAPYPRLIIPDGNDNIFLSPSAFNTMKPMEFIVDRYASLHSTYHMKGLILNNIPLIKRLRWREVFGFNIIYGTLSDKNNPEQQSSISRDHLFKLPEDTSPLGDKPYMEYSIGIENILKLIRVDYIRRISYNAGMTSKEKGFIRLEIRFTL